MITVHHLEVSRSIRILWLLEELGLRYEVKRYTRDPRTMRAPPELREIHPLGKAPVVTDGNEVFAESGAILETLLDRYGGGRLRPTHGSKDYERYRYWLHYAEGSLMPNLLLKLVFLKLPSGVPKIVKPLMKAFSKKVASVVVDPEIALHLGYIDRHLEGRTWFVGDSLTAADIQLSFPLDQANHRDTLGPNARAFVERVKAQPAYQRAVERAGS